MPKISPKELQAKFQKLPPALQDALFDANISKNIFDTGTKNNLTIEQTGLLADETGNLVLGFIRPEDFSGAIAESLSIPKDKAKIIAAEISKLVLFPLRSLLKTAHNMEIKGSSSAEKKEGNNLPPFMRGFVEEENSQAPASANVVNLGVKNKPLPANMPAGNVIRPELKNPAPPDNLPTVDLRSIPSKTVPPNVYSTPKVPPINLRRPASPATSPQNIQSNTSTPVKNIPSDDKDPYLENVEE